MIYAQNMKKAKMTIKMPDLSVSKSNQERASKLYANFLASVQKQVTESAADFSSLKTVIRMLKKSKQADPSESHVLDVIRRMQKDKLHSEIALQLSETSATALQNMQKTMLVQMIPYLLGMFATVTIVVLALFVRPFEFNNPSLQRYLIMAVPAIALFVWGLLSRRKLKFDMLSLNILMQASSAFASAKMQGKGEIGALQNLAEMKRRAATAEKKKTAKKS